MTNLNCGVISIYYWEVLIGRYGFFQVNRLTKQKCHYFVAVVLSSSLELSVCICYLTLLTALKTRNTGKMAKLLISLKHPFYIMI